RLGEPGQTAGDLGLPHAGGSDHDDVLRSHLVPELGGQVLAAPAVAERDGHRSLGALLADDVAVQLGDDLGGGALPAGVHSGPPSPPVPLPPRRGRGGAMLGPGGAAVTAPDAPSPPAGDVTALPR